MTSKEYLEHFGILGMKWGRRKSKTKSPMVTSKDHDRKMSIKKKKLHEMSNEELKDFTARLNLEKQYKDLNKNTRSAGVRFVTDTLGSIGRQMLNTYLQNYLDMGIKMAIKRVGG